MYTLQALQILIFLIPGLISSIILGMLIVRRKEPNEFEKIVEALIFSMLTYALFAIYSSKNPSNSNPITFDQTNNTVAFRPLPFLILIMLSVLLPIILAWIMNSDLHLRLARLLRMTKRTSRASVWYDVFYDCNSYVVVELADGTRICGWPTHFSDYPSEPYLYLENPKFIDENNQYVEPNLNGILITPEMKIHFVEFTIPSSSNTKEKTHDSRKRKPKD